MLRAVTDKFLSDATIASLTQPTARLCSVPEQPDEKQSEDATDQERELLMELERQQEEELEMERQILLEQEQTVAQ